MPDNIGCRTAVLPTLIHAVLTSLHPTDEFIDAGLIHGAIRIVPFQ